jgi:glycosyltransferase involved in cell wall biosynthesis
MANFWTLIYGCLLLVGVNCFGVNKQNKKLKFVSFPRSQTCFCSGPKILLVQLHNSLGGIRKNTLALYQGLLLKGCCVSILVSESPIIYADLMHARLPMWVLEGTCDYYLCKKKNHADVLLEALLEIYKCQKIDVVHVNLAGIVTPMLMDVFKQVAKKTKMKIILQLHDYSIPDASMFSCATALTSTSPQVVECLKRENVRFNLGIKDDASCIVFIPPVVMHDKFENFVTKYKNKNDFFKSGLGLDVNESPVLCVIANLNPCKNHRLLIHAVYKMIYEKQQPVHLVISGGGWDSLAVELKQLVVLLNLEKYVHFIGFYDDVGELLYYSDINVLPSSGEAFSIAVLEAALMKKPIIVSDAVGSVGQMIFHEKTGLVFESNNVDDLVVQIARLLDNKVYAEQLGDAAYCFAKDSFSHQKTLEYYINLYKRVVLCDGNLKKENSIIGV